MSTVNNIETEKDARLLSIVLAVIAALSQPLRSIVMRMEVGDRTGTYDFYIEEMDRKMLHFSSRTTEIIWDHFYEWRKPTQNAPDKWNLAVLRWSPESGVLVEYGHTDVTDISGHSARRKAWEKQEFGTEDIPFFIEPRKKKSESSAAEKT